MGREMLESSAISAFCESIAAMLSAGIQTDEALSILGDSSADKQFVSVCGKAHLLTAAGTPLSEALAATKAFPAHVIGTVASGEEAGRLEEVLRSLALYYSEESRLFAKVRQSVSYPATLFCIMAVIISFTVSIVLPVFTATYESFSGSLTTGSFASVRVSVIIGYVALGVTILCALLCVIGSAMARTERGRLKLIGFFEKFPMTKRAMYQLALSRFSSAFATYVSAGINNDTAMESTLGLVDHTKLRKKLAQVHASMIDPENPRSLAQAIQDNKVFETAYSRMLAVGSASGNVTEVMGSLSSIFFDDAIDQIDTAIDNIEPVMAAFMTVAIGATLIAVMLPLIGIMGSLS